MEAAFETPIAKPPLFDENSLIPSELHPHSMVCELHTVGDARHALARLRELRHDFDACTRRQPSSAAATLPGEQTTRLSGNGEEMLAGLSNIKRLRTIRSEIAYLENLMVRIATREFEMEEELHQSYLSSIGQWAERPGCHTHIH